MKPEDWKLNISPEGEILIAGTNLNLLAENCGTPLFVLNEDLLKETAEDLKRNLNNIYPGKASVHYPFKCNSVPAVIETIRDLGIKAEVMTAFELYLARAAGFREDEIIANGPCKTESFLTDCLDLKLVIIDSVSELKELAAVTRKCGRGADILLRINPDYTPEGMNSGSATGSRKGSVFGLDIKTGEASQALTIIKNSELLRFKGIHIHIGTGVRNPRDYYKVIISLRKLMEEINKAGFSISILDTGGGFASPNTRGLTSKELLLYQGFKKFPKGSGYSGVNISDYFTAITEGILQIFKESLPELIIEPGRYITSQSQLLLLKVHRIKERKGAGKWLITDGGIGTVAMPAYYEYHEIFPCRNAGRKPKQRVTISGPCCFAEDVIYKNKLMPEIDEGEIIAVMDCGAYFTQWESNFGFPKAGIVSVNENGHKLIRKRETSEQMLLRDIWRNNHEICSNKKQQQFAQG